MRTGRTESLIEIERDRHQITKHASILVSIKMPTNVARAVLLLRSTRYYSLNTHFAGLNTHSIHWGEARRNTEFSR